MHGDADALVVRTKLELDAAEQAWVQRQHRRALKAQGLTSKYQPHQGQAERERRATRLEKGN